MLSPALNALVVVLVTLGAMGLLALSIGRARPRLSEAAAEIIEPEKISAWATVLVGGAMWCGGLAATLTGRTGWSGLAIAFLGLCVAGFMAPSLTSVHMVRWDEDTIEGPSNLFGPTLGLRRAKIRWNKIVRTGTTAAGYWFVETQEGRRVYWSFLYKGYGALSEFIRSKRPDLVLPPGMLGGARKH